RVPAVVAAGLVVQQQRRRFRLTAAMTAVEQGFERLRMEGGGAEGDLPLVGDGGQRWIGGRPQRLHQRRQRRREVLVVADAEPVTLHVDAAAEARLVAVHRDQLTALLRGQDGRRPRG